MSNYQQEAEAETDADAPMQSQPIICTLNNIPTTASSLKKSRLPLAIHLNPFSNLGNDVVCEGPIIRCQYCRTYLNPYVRFGDQSYSSWQCNICNRLNQLPMQMGYANNNAALTNLSVEYIAGVEYMVRPPQPACYMIVFDCSKASTEVGFIQVMAKAVADLLDEIPGDARASIGFLAYDSFLHYFSFLGTQVVHYVSPDITTELIPCSTDGLLVNMTSKREMILDFLTQILPTFPTSDPSILATDSGSALGPAVKAAIKILKPIGGRITVIQAQLPNKGCPDDGSVLSKREDPSLKKNMAADKNGDYLTPLINPATDFYRNLALECCEHQISIDIFNLSTTYADIASIGALAKHSAGTIYHYSNSPPERNSTLLRFDQDFRNSLVRPSGLEAVLRLRYTRGLRIHTFHGNFFVRSHNLLILPNANPDSSYSLQIAIEDDLKPDLRFVYFQTSVLYTTPDGERRIRVHTARYPTAATLPEIIYGANQNAIVAMLAKMAVDRSLQTSIGEAKEALIGAAVDMLEVYAIADEMRARSYAAGLPENLRLVPLYILALLKHSALKLSVPMKLDDRTAAMERFKTLPVYDLITYIYPDLYPLQYIETDQSEGWKNPIQLTAAHIERNGAYLLDAYDIMIIYVCEYIDPRWCHYVFGVNEYQKIPEYVDLSDQANASQPIRPRDPANFTGPPNPYGQNIQKESSRHLLSVSELANTSLVRLPKLENQISVKLRDLIQCLLEYRPQKPKFYVIKENSRYRSLFTQYLVDDRSENYHSYAEFWKFLQDQTRK